MSVVYGMQPTIHQQEVIDYILNTPAKYIAVNGSRQSAKTLVAMNLILYYGINQKGIKIAFISPYFSMVKKVMRDFIDAIKDSGIIESQNMSDYIIKLKTGSDIIFRSAENYDALRGYTFDIVIMDECSYIRDDAWMKAIKPTALIKGQKVLMFSTPRTKTGFFFDTYSLGKSGNPLYGAIDLTYKGNPFVNWEEIEDARKVLPQAIFKAEYEGEFIEGESSVFANFKENIQQGIITPQGKVFCGIDLARKGDYTVAVFIDTNNKVVDILKVNNTSWENIVKQLLTKIRKYNASVLVESNSIGDVIIEQLKKEWNNITPFTTTNESKKEIIETLIYAFNSNGIKIPDDKDLIHELEVFEMTYSPQSRSVKYAARPPFNDDMVIALALANYHKTQNKSYGNYGVYGGKK